MNDKKLYNIFSNLINGITIVIALVFFVISAFQKSLNLYEWMILTLLIAIATSLLAEHYADNYNHKDGIEEINNKLTSIQNSIENKMDNGVELLENNLNTKSDSINNRIDSIADCEIECFDSTVKLVERIEELLSDNTRVHSFDSVALDASTRSKAKSQHSKMWQLFLQASGSSNVKFTHLVRMRSNLFENLLDRISQGGSHTDSYFAYFKLPKEFSFAAYEIIDDTYVAIRSPYQSGEKPRYLLIKNVEIVKLFENWYNHLWEKSTKITKVEQLYEIYNKEFKSQYDEETQKRLEGKLNKIQENGIMDDI